jgi:transcriptional regulator with XRE-family HTH domain
MQSPSPQNTFRSWFVEHLALEGWSQADFVKEAKVPQSAVSQWILRDGQQPSIKNARKVARAFKVSLLEVLVVAGYITRQEARFQASGETTLREASLHQILLQAQLRTAALQKEVEALREGRIPEGVEWSEVDVPGLKPRGGSASSPAAENHFL